MALAPEEQARLQAMLSPPPDLDAGAGAAAGGAPPPVPPPMGAVQTPDGPQPLPGEIPAVSPGPGTQFVLPPDVAARAKQQALSLPPVGPAPHGPGDSVPFSGAGAGGAPGPAPVAAPSPVTTSSTSRTTQQGIALSPETQAAAAQAAAAGRAASADRPGELRELGAAQGVTAAARGDYQQIAADNAAAEAKQRADHEAALAPQKIELRDAQEALAKRAVDPGHFMHSRSTLQRIGLVLAQVAGAFGSTLTHTPNAAAEIINGQIERDIDGQKANIAKGQKDLENKVGSYNLAAGAFRSQEEKDGIARAMKLAAAQEQIRQAAEAEQDPLARQRLLATGQELAQKQQEASLQLDQATSNRVSTTTHSTTTSGGPGAASGSGLPADRVARGPDGKMLLFADAKSAGEHRAMQVSADRANSVLTKLDALDKGIGSGIPGFDAHTDTGVKAEELKAVLAPIFAKRAKALGVDSKEFAEKTVGSPDSFAEWHWPARSKALRQAIGEAMQDSAAEATPLDSGSLAIQSGKPVYAGTGIPTLAAPKGGKR
jgi:hypothetical protein